ncbi:uncharacterized protein BCR38DRAFT_442441 [Pseudomassariella vexata]|uniref:Uncharacterized protein n=1 Tax=Pseudomassariella vexata TaxID=1141098 RepID=A0A1Y2DNM3_9PEZI|nr:uncharacterized protein BCR38DRAFT_442441 [Pseudomassariella vexata]ORY60769.1 hypothetical protein BCR38DRAFT_442441 [Pseudomassariella vexata]
MARVSYGIPSRCFWNYPSFLPATTTQPREGQVLRPGEAVASQEAPLVAIEECGNDRLQALCLRDIQRSTREPCAYSGLDGVRFWKSAWHVFWNCVVTATPGSRPVVRGHDNRHLTSPTFPTKVGTFRIIEAGTRMASIGRGTARSILHSFDGFQRHL